MYQLLSYSKTTFVLYRVYILFFLCFLLLPLAVSSIFAFNDSQFATLPWQGFTLDWFFGTSDPVGLFHDDSILTSFKNTIIVGVATTALSLVVGTSTAFLFDRFDFPFKRVFYALLLVPLVIPGVIIGISILSMGNTITNWLYESWDIEIEMFRPGLFLIVMGQFSYIATLATLIVGARLKKMNRSHEEAALNLGATPVQVFFTITLPFLKPALIAAGILCFLMSMQDFSATVLLAGSDSPLTVTMFSRVKNGTTPLLNAVSVMVLFSTALLGLTAMFFQNLKQR